MFREKITALTAGEVWKKLASTGGRPDCGGDLSIALAGSVHVFLMDDGRCMTYRFCPGTVEIIEDEAVQTLPYGALRLNELTLIAHRLSSGKEYRVIALDGAGRVSLITVHYGEEPAMRDMWGEIAFGTENPADPVRHRPTRRLEGRGVYWTRNDGTREISLYSSCLYSSFLHPGEPDGEYVACAPSEYVEIDDNTYLYTRMEAEFSGCLTVEAMDFFSLRAVGVRIGIDSGDKPVFHMYESRGRYLGQLATFTPLFGGQEARFLSPRPVYRPKRMTKPMTDEDVTAAIESCREGLFTGGLQGNEMARSGKMEGRAFDVRFDDGEIWEYSFPAADQVCVSRFGEESQSRCDVFEADADLFFIAHMFGSDARESASVVIDWQNGLVTCVGGQIGNRRSTREIRQTIRHGVIDRAGAPVFRRHRETTDLIGQSYAWNYTQSVASQHVYSSPRALSWAIFLPDGAGGLMWSAPCRYIKVRPDVYIVSWVEEESAGTMGTLLFNRRIMHDIGTFHGINHEGVYEFYSFGAKARSAGAYDMTGIYD